MADWSQHKRAGKKGSTKRKEKQPESRGTQLGSTLRTRKKLEHSTSRSWTKRGLQSRLQVAAGREDKSEPGRQPLSPPHPQATKFERTAKFRPPNGLPSHLPRSSCSFLEASLGTSGSNRSGNPAPASLFVLLPLLTYYPTLGLSLCQQISESTTSFGSRKLGTYPSLPTYIGLPGLQRHH